jgi:hypothetical protein
MYSDEMNAKMQAQLLQTQDMCSVPQSQRNCVQGLADRAPYSLCEEAAKSEQHHYAEAAKAGSASRFLSSHPEFDEFVRLVRSGAIRF